MVLLRLLILLLLAVAGPARAATFDPALTWRTIETEHFHVHFHQGEEKLADDFALMAEEVYDELVADLRWRPTRRIEVLLVDRTDLANGYASTVPYPRIVIYVTAPQASSSLGLYEDWSRTIFTHELTHILHLDANHGIVRLARLLAGRVASTNQISPRWMVEGLATYEETEHTSGGRGRAPLADMIIRTAVISDEFPPLGNLDGYQPDPPGGNLRYLFGEDFIRYVARQQGDDVWTRWLHTYGASIPYLLPSKRVFGERLVPLYHDWHAWLQRHYAAQLAPVEAEGPIEGELVTTDPDASCAAPAFAPTGDKLVWSCSDLRTGQAIWMADGQAEGARILLEDRGANSFTWRRDGEAFVYAGLHIVNRFNIWSDIYLYEIGAEHPQAITAGKRARDPAFTPDGSKLLVVTNKVQNNQLEVMTVDRILEPLTEITDHTQFSTPMYSPDGRAVAVSVWQDGQRDLWLYSPEGEPLRRLTLDRALERDPWWSADGRWLYFSSDRSGIPNIYAIDVTTERLWQVTNVRTGAVQPTAHPDGTRLAYAQYSQEGWQVRLLDLDPDRFLDRGHLPRPLRFGTPLADLVAPVDAPAEDAGVAWAGEPLEGPLRGGGGAPPFLAQAPPEATDTFDDAEVEDVFGEEQDYPFRIPPQRYNPLPSLLPTFYLPYLQLTPYPSDVLGTSFGLVGSASTGASDPAAFLGWGASLSYRTDAHFLGASAAITLNRFLPVFTLRARRTAVPFTLFLEDPLRVGPSGVPEVEIADRPYWERRHDLSMTVSWPYKLRTTVFARYHLTFRDNKDPLPADVWQERIPIRGRVGRVSAGWRYAWAEPTRYAISTEDGRIFSLVASLLHPWLGTAIRDDAGDLQPLTQVQLTAEFNEYLVNPLIPNHVLAGRVAGGAALGGTEFLGTYQLGGSIGDSPFYVTPDEFRMLRGHPFGADVGDYYWLGSAEYRFPLWRIERGVGTLPAYARHVSGVLFADVGNAFEQVDTAEDLYQGTLLGVGAELRFATVIGWNLGITGRLGYAAGFGPTGYAATDPRTLYFRFGGSF